MTEYLSTLTICFNWKMHPGASRGIFSKRFAPVLHLETLSSSGSHCWIRKVRKVSFPSAKQRFIVHVQVNRLEGNRRGKDKTTKRQGFFVYFASWCYFAVEHYTSRAMGHSFIPLLVSGHPWSAGPPTRGQRPRSASRPEREVPRDPPTTEVQYCMESLCFWPVGSRVATNYLSMACCACMK